MSASERVCTECKPAVGERIGVAGERFGKYTCLGPAKPRGGQTYIKLRCDCGREVQAYVSHWKFRPAKACARCTRKRSPFGAR